MKHMVFVSADEVAEQLSISKPFAYKIIKGLNKELEAKGFITIAGRVSRKFFEERVYGIVDEIGGVIDGDFTKQEN